MTNQPAPGQPQHPSGPGGPYGPPPPPHPSSVPGPRPPQQYQPQQQPAQPAPQPRQQDWAPPERTDKGLVGALFDANFNHMVTPKLIKLFYIMALLLVSMNALAVLAVGIWVAQLRNGWLLGLIIICSSPFLWVFEAILVRILMEAVVVRFKGVEYLRIIKDKI